MNDFSLNLEKVPKELKLLLDIINKSIENNGPISPNLLTNVDWDQFLKLSIHHRLYPVLYSKLKMVDKNKVIPSSVMKSLYNKYKSNTFHMLHLSGVMEQISQFFSEHNIPSLVLKGPVVAADLYGDISLRTCGDLDVLIPINELEKVDMILENHGYEKDDYIQTVLNDWKWRHHHITYFHPQKKVKLEIHWRLNPGPSKEPNFYELWSRKRVCSLTSYPVYFLGREDLFFFLISHGARHGWSRLRWLLDIKQMMNKHDLDWKVVIRLLKKYQHLHVGGQAMILASQLLNAPIIEDMKLFMKEKHAKRLAQDAVFYLEKMVNLHTDPVPQDIASYHKNHLFSLMSKQQKILFMMSFLYPYPEDAQVLPLPKNLHFLYFPLRPFIWAWRKTGSVLGGK